MRLTLTNIFSILLMLVLMGVVSYSQTPEFTGLKFNSKNVELYERTSAAIFNDDPVTIKNKISVSFDISFWTLKYFGTIWRIENNKKEFSRLVFNQFKDPQYYYFQLFLDQQSEPLEIILLREKLNRNSWIQINIDLNLAADSITFSAENISSVSRNLISPDNFRSTIYFGLKSLNDINDYDLPGFYLRNLKISVDEKHYHWELNPKVNTRIYDKVSKRKINLTNESWLIEDHYEWQLINSLKGAVSPLFAYDSLKSRIFIDLKDELLIYDLFTLRVTAIQYKNKRPGQFSELIYNHFTDQLYSTFVGGGQVSVFDFKNLYWTLIDTTNEINGHYYGSVRFINSLDSSLYMFGGYGWHTAKNNFFKYDFIDKKWNEVLINGRISPRYNTAITQGFKQGEYLLFGGNGNEDGNQEKGFRYYFDLYSLDLKHSTINQYWSVDGDIEQQKSNFMYPRLFLIPDDSSFYSLKSHSINENLYWKMYRTQINQKYKISVGTDIFIPLEERNQKSFFFFNSQTNEFIYLRYDADSMKTYISSLRYPPVESSVFMLAGEQKNILFNIWILFVIPGLIILLVLVYFIRKRKTNDIITKADLNDYQLVQKKKNSVHLFGEAKILNASGNDTFRSFSPKLKEIFLLILIRSINNHHNGITSEELSVAIWPDSSPESAKSNRGVAINKIRKALSSVDGVDLEFKNRLWVVKIKNNAKCDYQEYLKISSHLRKNDNADIKLLAQCLNLLEDGEFLGGISYEWLDSFKLAVNNEIIGFLKEFLNGKSAKIPNDVNLRLKICDVILKFDRVDEDAFKLKIRTHYEAGNHQLAKNTYKILIAEYKHLYDEEYPLTFQEILFSK